MQIIKAKKGSSHSICLNLCSTCNLNCSWCYKQAFDEPSLAFADFEIFYKSIISQNIEAVTLIGGEPTMHPHFIQIMELLKNKQVFLNTNGLMFSNLNFLNAYIGTGEMLNLKFVSISLKGYDEESFARTTGTYKFGQLCHAICNLKDVDISTTYSYTYDECMTEQQRESFASFLTEHGIDTILLNDVRPYYQADKDNKIAYPNMAMGLEILFHFLENVGIKVYLRLNRPFCEYSQAFIDYVVKNHRLISQCAVKIGAGYFFSTSLELIPCNELSSVVLGKFAVDFNNFIELEQLWNMQHIRNFYQRLSGYPDIKCRKCKFWRICGGSCILYWLNTRKI